MKQPWTADDLALHHPAFGVGAGLYKDVWPLSKFGHNDAVGATLETLWNEGGLYVYPAAATVMKISSSDTDDTAAGAGAQTVEIQGLGASYEEINETVSLNGQTAVNTVKSYLRVHRMIVRSAGASLGNEGTIYAGVGSLTAGKPDTVYGLIDPGFNQTLMGLYTIPRGTYGVLVQTYIGSSIAKAVSAFIFAQPIGETFQVQRNFELIDGGLPDMLQAANRFEAKTDVEMRVKAVGGGGHIVGQMDIYCVRYPE